MGICNHNQASAPKPPSSVGKEKVSAQGSQPGNAARHRAPADCRPAAHQARPNPAFDEARSELAALDACRAELEALIAQAPRSRHSFPARTRSFPVVPAMCQLLTKMITNISQERRLGDLNPGRARTLTALAVPSQARNRA
jgi:hypothetical protein